MLPKDIDNPQAIHFGWSMTVTKGGKITSALFNGQVHLCREEGSPKIITMPYQLLPQPFLLNGPSNNFRTHRNKKGLSVLLCSSGKQNVGWDWGKLPQTFPEYPAVMLCRSLQFTSASWTWQEMSSREQIKESAGLLSHGVQQPSTESKSFT